jgi:hypothetical protein
MKKLVDVIYSLFIYTFISSIYSHYLFSGYACLLVDGRLLVHANFLRALVSTLGLGVLLAAFDY